MVCDVSLFLPQAHAFKNPKTLSACRWCSECQMKLSLEVDVVIHGKGTGRSRHHRSKYVPVDWGTRDGPSNAFNGLTQGLIGMGQEMVGALTGVVVEPVIGGRKDGIKGGIVGLRKGLKNLVMRPLRGGLILVDKTSAGVVAHIQKQSDDSKTPFRRFIFYDKLHQIGSRIDKANVRRRKFDVFVFVFVCVCVCVCAHADLCRGAAIARTGRTAGQGADSRGLGLLELRFSLPSLLYSLFFLPRWWCTELLFFPLPRPLSTRSGG